MKKNRFYNNKKRNLKWTEKARGRQVDFADKYAGGGIYSDKFDYLRPKPKKRRKRLTPLTALKTARVIGAVIISALLIFAGYTIMDVYMQRHKMPSLSQTQGAGETAAQTESAASLGGCIGAGIKPHGENGVAAYILSDG